MELPARHLLFFFWLKCLVLSNAENPYCNPCGYRMAIPPSHWDVEIDIPTQGSFTCGRIETRSREGFVEAQHCSSLQVFTKPRCGCVPRSSLTPAPSESPSLEPSSAPSMEPTQEPSLQQASDGYIASSTLFPTISLLFVAIVTFLL